MKCYTCIATFQNGAVMTRIITAVNADAAVATARIFFGRCGYTLTVQ